MRILEYINLFFSIVFTLCYLYQFVYLIVAYVGRPKAAPNAPPSKIAVLVAARNEEAVIGNLLASLNAQDYPKDLYSVIMVADNCTDRTAEIGREMGATVYERTDSSKRGKGYALDYLIKCVIRDFGEDHFDAFIVFDADNIANENYIREINNTFALGYDVVTSYRNATNYGASWRAAGQGMFFLRESRVLNLARMKMGCNTYVMGTGFLFSKNICKKYRGWPFHCLTEDGEFTMENVINGIRTGYSNSAMFYDEQATTLRASWNQQLRWCKGGIQIYRKYILRLIKALFSKKFLSSFDMMMCLNAAYFISLSAVVTNLLAGVFLLSVGAAEPLEVILIETRIVIMIYAMLMAFSLPITASEWRYIRCSGFKKIFYAFTFPLFLFSFVPAAVVALFKRVEWKNTRHEGTDPKSNEKIT